MNHCDVLSPVYLPDPVERHHPINRGLVSWWLTLPGLDGGNKFYDLVGLNHGQLVNMTTSASGWRGTTRPGGSGSLLFDGSNDYVTFGDYGDFGTDPFTVTLWVRGGVNQQSVFIKDNFSGSGSGIFFWCGTATTYTYWNGTGDTTFGANTNDGNWHQLAITRTGAGVSQATLHFDGRAVNTLTESRTLSNAFELRLGISANGQGPFTGSFDDIRIYNRALSAAEVRSLYDLSRNAYPGVLRRLSVPMPGGSASRLLMLRRRAA